MSRLAAPFALRRLALPVFCAAALLMWLCMALAGLLAPQFERDGVRYSWPDGAAQTVRRVVIDAPQVRRYGDIELKWSDSEAPVVVTGVNAGNFPEYKLDVEGDTLYVRPHPLPEANAAKQSRRKRADITSLTLPMQVSEVHGPRLSVACKTHLPTLTLRGADVFVGHAHVDDLRILATDATADEDGDDDNCRADEVHVNAQNIGKLHIETNAKSVSLSHISHLDAVTVRAPQDTDLRLNRIGDASRIQWQEMPASERANCKRALRMKAGDD